MRLVKMQWSASVSIVDHLSRECVQLPVTGEAASGRDRQPGPNVRLEAARRGKSGDVDEAEKTT